MQQTLSNVTERVTSENIAPNEAAKQAAKEALVMQGGQISKQENVHNADTLFATFFALVDTPEITKGHLDKLVLERGPVIADFFNAGANMAALSTLRDKMTVWKKEDFPQGNAPQITIKKASNLSRVGGTEDVYSALYKDLATIAADKPE